VTAFTITEHAFPVVIRLGSKEKTFRAIFFMKEPIKWLLYSYPFIVPLGKMVIKPAIKAGIYPISPILHSLF